MHDDPPSARRLASAIASLPQRVRPTWDDMDLVRMAVRIVRESRGERARDVGLAVLGYGGQRVALGLPTGEVLKVEYLGPEEDGNLQENQEEAARWERADPAEAARLCPVLAAGDGWLVMERADDYDFTAPDEAWEALRTISPTDTTDSNVGWYEGRLVLLDYGR